MATLVSNKHQGDIPWYEQHNKKVGLAAAILGIAITAMAVGFILANYASTTSASTTSINCPSSFDMHSKAAMDLGSLQELQMVGNLGYYFVALGVGFAIAGTCLYHKKTQKNDESVRQVISFEEKIKTDAKKWKSVALVVGFTVAMIGVGMFVGSLLLLKFQIPAMHDITAKYAGDSFWQSLQSSCIDPTATKLKYLLTGGIFTAIAGCGLMVTGYGASAIKEKISLLRGKRKESLEDL